MAVWPREKGAGWTMRGLSLTLTVNLPCATAAGWILTAPLMTTVPVRALTMTLAGASAGLISIFSIMPIIMMRSVAPGAAVMSTDTASVARARLSPKVRLMPSATRRAVVRSASARLKVRVGAVSKPVATARSTVAPPGMRPAEGMFTETWLPSAPETPRPPTARLPCDMA